MDELKKIKNSLKLMPELEKLYKKRGELRDKHKIKRTETKVHFNVLDSVKAQLKE